MRHREWLLALVCCLVIGAAVVAGVSPPPYASPTGEEPRAEKKAEAAYRGNTETHKFHRKGCRYYSCTNCTAKFRTRDEAIAEGYRPCGTCLP